MKPRFRFAPAPRRHAQRGIVGLLALMFIIIVVFFAMTQASTISSSNITDSSRQADAVEALFLAESAIEKVGYRFVTSGSPPTCDGATVGVGEGDITLGRGAYRVLAVYTTGFGGSGTLPSTQCRVRVQGEITATRVTRTIDTIVGTEDDLISISSLNPNFNAVPYDDTRVDDEDHAPTNWSLSGGTAGTGSMAYVAWDQTGGNSDDNLTCRTDAAIPCDRAAFARKTDTGTGVASAGGAFNTTGVPIYITAPKTLRLTFDFRVWTRGSSSQEMFFSPRLVFDTGTFEATGDSGGDCSSTSAAGWCESGPTASGSPAWKGSYGKGCGYIDTACFESGPADGSCPTYDPDSSYNGVGGTTGSGGRYSECVGDGHNPPVGSTGYRTGNLTYNITGSGQVQLTSISFTRADGTGALKGKSGNITWLWVDNLRLSVPSLSGGGPAKNWREVDPSSA